MSGLITSLLIEPVVRQARRLSQQTEESSPPVTQASSIYDRYSSDGGEEDCDNIARGVMSYSEQEIRPNIGAYGEYVPSEDSPSSVMLWSTGFNDQNHETEIFSLSHRARQITDNDVSEVSDNHAVIMNGSDLTEPQQATSAAISTHDVSQQTSSTLRRTQRLSHSHLDLVDTGGKFSLPEDDGMGALRKKIHAIRDLNHSSMEQARMIHELMTENYNAFRSNLDNQTITRTPPLFRPRSSDRSVAPNNCWGSQSFDQQSLTPSSLASIAHQENQYCLTAEDLKPTFYPRDELQLPPEDIDDTDAEEFEEACLGCRHYKRNVKLQCYACKKWCESYNTAQIRLMNGDIPDSVEDDYAREGFIASRTRSSSQGTGNIALPVLATSILDPNSGNDIDSNARYNAPVSAESSGRFSYSISRGRAVSPVISNYFGIPPDRGSERPKSTSFFNGRALQENEDENSGEIRFWGAKFKYRYGFLSRGTESVDGTSEANDEEDGDEGNGDDDERSWCSRSDDDNDDEDDDDEEKIDIFGHR
ncbi:CHY and RING finger domain protein [Aspergillus flavus]|uniref:CHY and RING finger domain protein n=1 Tax=Aspergillus flavus TaxID=5059 RepID=A0AB74CDL9_ASPFL|nr:CHY and RING finger domain protein [Aspergillus flavus]RAQ63270.1 CHY and RING finger domain protein [Aspergillus flavus]RMZ44620.1 CHY and RING finger domain protein [Aspergillus flavus]